MPRDRRHIQLTPKDVSQVKSVAFAQSELEKGGGGRLTARKVQGIPRDARQST